MILPGRPQYSEELVIHKTSVVAGVCCWAAPPAQPSGLHCAAHTLWPQDKPTAAEEIGDTSHLVAVIMLSACLCFYLKVQQEVLI